MNEDLAGRIAKAGVRHYRRFGGRAVWLARQPRLWSYLISDRRPWRVGYAEYKELYLRKAFRDSALLSKFKDGGPLPSGYGWRLDARVVEIPWALSMLQPNGCRLLDAGSSLNYEYVLEAEPLSRKEVTILTLAPEMRCYWHRGISYVFGDLRGTVFKDECFDEIVCISTIEHVGMDNSRYVGGESNSAELRDNDHLRAVSEIRRTIVPGGRLLLTFPYGKHEVHGWFQQFDADHVDRILETFRPSELRESIFKYTMSGWELSDRVGSADCEFFDVHASRYFNASSKIGFPPDYPAGERAVACLELRR